MQDVAHQVLDPEHIAPRSIPQHLFQLVRREMGIGATQLFQGFVRVRPMNEGPEVGQEKRLFIHFHPVSVPDGEAQFQEVDGFETEVLDEIRPWCDFFGLTVDQLRDDVPEKENRCR